MSARTYTAELDGLVLRKVSFKLFNKLSLAGLGLELGELADLGIQERVESGSERSPAEKSMSE